MKIILLRDRRLDFYKLKNGGMGVTELEAYNHFYELIKDKYPKLREGVRVHIWPEKNIIISTDYNSDEIKRSISFLDTEELIMLAECDGRNTSEEILEKLCGMYINVPKIRLKVMEFFRLYQDKYFVFEEQKQNIVSVFEITGSKGFFIPIYYILEINLDDTVIRLDKLLSILKSMYEHGCRFIEILGDGILSDKSSKEILSYIFKYYDLVFIKMNDFIASRSIMNLIQANREKVIFGLNTYDENKFLRLKKEINKIDLLKKGYEVVEHSGEKIVSMGEVINRKTGISCNQKDLMLTEMYIKSDGRVKLVKLPNYDFLLGNILREPMESILRCREELIRLLMKIKSANKDICKDCENVSSCVTYIDSIWFNIKSDSYCEWALSNNIEKYIKKIGEFMI